jgi:hypothetical protein
MSRNNKGTCGIINCIIPILLDPLILEMLRQMAVVIQGSVFPDVDACGAFSQQRRTNSVKQKLLAGRPEIVNLECSS